MRNNHHDGNVTPIEINTLHDVEEDDSLHQQNMDLLIDLEAKWKQIELAATKKHSSKSKSSNIFRQERKDKETIQYKTHNTLELSNMIHQRDNSFEGFCYKKIRELEQLKSAKNNTKSFNDAKIGCSGNDNQFNYKHDPIAVINDNSKLEKKLKSVFSLIAPHNEISEVKEKREDNQANSKPKKTFLTEPAQNEKDKPRASKYSSVTNNKSSNQPTQQGKDTRINNQIKPTLKEENDIKHKLKQNTMLLKQLFPVK